MIKNNEVKKLSLDVCPKRKIKFKSGKEEIDCECEEEICDEELVEFPEDFVWHPSEKY